jgi:Protein of unknown function (DUF3306)
MSHPVDEEAGGFLGRWARRKQEAARGPAEPAAAPPEPAPSLEPAAPAEQPALPSLDDIVPGADVSAFFGAHVPEVLRAAALRKLWVTDPQIKNFIEMADYQWDFTNPDSIPGWSSSLEGVDVKAMAERIFNVVAKVAPESDAPIAPEALRGAAEDEAGEPLETADELTDTPAIPAASTPYSIQIETAPEQNGALQEKTSLSNGYETARRRHGGALPT